MMLRFRRLASKLHFLSNLLRKLVRFKPWTDVPKSSVTGLMFTASEVELHQPQDRGSLPSSPAPLSNIERRYALLPQLQDSDNLPLVWHPYVMRWTKPNYCSPSMNTNELGLRVTLDRAGVPLKYSDYMTINTGQRRGVFTGNSTAFGIGTSSDALTVPSLLNKADSQGCVWYNLAMRAFNLTQERLATDLYGPPQVDYFVLLSGLNNLIVILLGQGGSHRLCPFVGEPTFMQTLNGQPVALAQLPSVDFLEASISEVALEMRYREVLATTERDLALLAATRQVDGRQLLFCLQPSLAWTQKPLTPEEKNLVEIWDDSASILHRIHRPDIINAWQDRFVEDLKQGCLKWGVDFLDLNTDPVIAGKDWIFADRVHLVNKGHERIAELIQDWTNSC